MKFASRILRVAVAVVLGLGVVLGSWFLGARHTLQQSAAPAWTPTDRLAATRRPAPDQQVVAVVLGTTGTVGSDALAPYDVFARSRAFHVYTVAATDGTARVESGPGIRPDHTFAEVDSDPALTPDVVVVPAVTDAEGDDEAGLRAWVKAQAGRGARVLGVCSGARVLAAAGLLDGRRATSHWSQLSWLRAHHPGTTWVPEERYVVDGRLTTTAGVTSGVPGALSVIAAMVDRDEAARVGAEVGYPDWSVDAGTTLPPRAFGIGDVPVALNVLEPWFRPTYGIALSDGMDEIDVAGAFEVYAVTHAARAVPVSRTGTVVTRHGVVLVTETADPGADRVLVPGRDPVDDLPAWVEDRGLRTDQLVGPSGRSGFDGALEYLARDSGAAMARSAAKLIDYPADGLVIGNGPSSRRTASLVAVTLALAIAVALLPTWIRRWLRGGPAR